jgi:hypothetical protein
MDEPAREKTRLEKVNQIIRIILALGTIGILLVAAIAMWKRGTTGY